MADLSYLDAVILGVVEGLTEYLPVSSTGHLTITEQLLGLKVDDLAVTAYTAVIQLGAIAATLLYFFKDIVRFAVAWARGLGSAEARKDPDYGLAWAVVIGSVPVGIEKRTSTTLFSRNLTKSWEKTSPELPALSYCAITLHPSTIPLSWPVTVSSERSKYADGLSVRVASASVAFARD